MTDTEHKPAEVNGTEVGPALSPRERYDVEYWLNRGGEKALREAEDLDGFGKVLWDARDEYIITNGGPVGMTLSGSKADNVLDWIDALSAEELDYAFSE